MPVYNAESHITGVIKRIPNDLWQDILDIWIINDGSTDRTGEVLDSLAAQYAKIRLIHHPCNKGYGAAVKTGLLKCKESACSYAVCLHADGQYPPEFIRECLEFMRSNRHAIVQGSRIASGTALSGGMPRYKYVAGKILTFLENKVFGLSMTDYHSGFLCYSREALDNIQFRRLSSSFDFDLEVIASARAAGLRIGEVPIPTRYADEVSYLNPLTYGFRVIMVMFRYTLGMYRRAV